jgi:hypothetical protein
MKLKRKSKVSLWFDESRKQRVSAEEWLKTDEGKQWLKQWCANHRGEELDAILSALPISEEP